MKVVSTTTTPSSSNARAFQIVSVTQASTTTTTTEDQPFQNQTDVGPNGTLPPTTTLDQSSTNGVFPENVTTEDPRLEKITNPSDMTQAPTSSTTKSRQFLASSTVAAYPKGTSEIEIFYNR